MAKSTIQIDLDDPRTGKIADVISNKTCKKILAALAEAELSQTDISTRIQSPLNTIDYNIKKLEQAGLVEKAKNHFWSVKGKRIPTYRVANKRIIITPTAIVRGIIPAILITALITLTLGVMSINSQQKEFITLEDSVSGSRSVMSSSAEIVDTDQLNSDVREADTTTPGILDGAWLWFFTGALTSLIIYLLWNYIIKGPTR